MFVVIWFSANDTVLLVWVFSTLGNAQTGQTFLQSSVVGPGERVQLITTPATDTLVSHGSRKKGN